MADVLKKINDGVDFVQGGITVSVGVLGITANHTKAPDFNAVAQFIQQSGVLDSRFDDITFYGA